MLSIPQAVDYQYSAAATKVSWTTRPLGYLTQSMLAGAYIGIAVVLMFSAAGPLAAEGSGSAPLVQGLVFGIALTLVLTAGGELATSNMMTLTQGGLGRSITWPQASGTLLFSFFANLAGAIVFATFVHLTGLLEVETPAGQMLVDLLAHKSHETVPQLFFRGVLCNILVCLAIWAAVRLQSEGAKLAVIFWCLLAFITSGFEHVVANMTTFSLGLLGGHTTLAEAGRNLSIVGIGNLVGGMIVGIAYVIAARGIIHAESVNEPRSTSEVSK